MTAHYRLIQSRYITIIITGLVMMDLLGILEPPLFCPV
jgi:hypothetical protein